MKRVRTTLFITGLICLCSAFAVAQKGQKPNFSGTWELDEKKTKRPFENFGKRKSNPDPKQKVSVILVIDHADPDITLIEKIRIETLDESGTPTGSTEKESPKWSYFTDGRGETNEIRSSEPYSSVTKWDGKKLISVTYLDEKKTKMSIRTYRISKDGRELVVTDLGYGLNYDFTTHRERVAPIAVGSKNVYRKVD